MGKQGPCCHCGITTTPLWRNGPAEKPVLCNACGSRWRTKGTLLNYMPMHSGGLGLKSGSTKKGTPRINEHRPQKRKEPSNGFSEYYYYQGSDYNTSGMLDDDASTRSSTGSGISFSESCAQHTMANSKPSECWPPWGFHVPSKKRTLMHRYRQSTKKFSRRLSESGSFTCRYPSDEDLLVEYKPSATVEIGLGGVFIRSPFPVAPTQESQASSIMSDNKDIEQSVALHSSNTRETSPDIEFSDRNVKYKGKEKTKHLTKTTGTNKILLENFPYSKRNVLQSCHSPLVFVELKDIINFNTFTSLLTGEEQQQLGQYLSSADNLSESLKSMFSSAQFESSMRGFQNLLSQGMFDSESGVSPRVLQHYQQLLILLDLTASGWTEQCSEFPSRAKRKEYAKIVQGKELSEKWKNLHEVRADNHSSLEDAVAEAEKGRGSIEVSDVSSQKYGQQNDTTDKLKRIQIKTDYVEEVKHSSHSNGRNVKMVDKLDVSNQGCKSPIWRCKPVEAPMYGVLEHDVLLDLPSNVSFQQAELLQKPVWSKFSPTKSDANQKQKTDSTTGQNVWSTETEADLDWSGILWNSPSMGSVDDTF